MIRRWVTEGQVTEGDGQEALHRAERSFEYLVALGFVDIAKVGNLGNVITYKFEDYFDHAGTMTSRIMLKPLEDPHVDLIANVSAAGDKASGTEVKRDALFCWQKILVP